jgi:hypothetical protein
MKLRPLSHVAAPLLAALALVSSAHCGDDTTGRERVSFEVYATALRAESDSSMGWRVRIEQAAVAVGPIRWYEGAPLFGELRRMFTGVAWAHPGHYVPGGALADITTRGVVDLMAATPVRLATATGVSGAVQSAHLELHPAADDLGAAGAALRNGSLSLRGTATRGDVTVRFEAAPRIDVNIEGIPAEATLDGAPGRFVVGVDLGALVDRVDFATLPSSSAETVAFPAEGQASNALYRGAVSGASWRFTWVAGSAP